MDDFEDLSDFFKQLRDNSTGDDDYFNDLDTSEYPFPNILWHMKPTWEIALKCTFMLIVCITGIYMNFVILLIIIKNRFLWTATNYLVGNLALVDLLTLLLCPWPWLVRDFYQSYVLGSFGCRFEAFLQTTFLLATVGAVVLVSYDRLASAALTMEARVTKSGATKLILGSWFTAIVLSAPWIFNRQYVQRHWLDYLEAYCMEHAPYIYVYWHIVVSILVWVPIGLMIVTYGGIMWRIERSARKLKSRGGGQLVGRARGKAMRITACILIVAAVCRLPYTAMVYWRNNLQPVINSVSLGYNKMWFAANCLIYVSSAINPLIYGFTNERFRRAMDRTPGVACCKFGSWCCVCKWNVKKTILEENKNEDKIFVIGGTPKLDKKIPYLIRNILHIHKETLEFSAPKSDECTNKPTRITPLNECL